MKILFFSLIFLANVLIASDSLTIKSPNGKITAIANGHDINVGYGKQTAIELTGILSEEKQLLFVKVF